MGQLDLLKHHAGLTAQSSSHQIRKHFDKSLDTPESNVA
jgi:hypothetical protein